MPGIYTRVYEEPIKALVVEPAENEPEGSAEPRLYVFPAVLEHSDEELPVVLVGGVVDEPAERDAEERESEEADDDPDNKSYHEEKYSAAVE